MKDVAQLEALLAPVAADHGLEIVDVELVSDRGSRVVRLFVDLPGGGVGVEDCARMSRDCSALLDAEDLIDGRYRLEVSSPGIERRLRKLEHFEQQLGQRVHALLKRPVGGRKRITGTLKQVRDDAIEVELAEGQKMKVPLSAIRRANLKVF